MMPLNLIRGVRARHLHRRHFKQKTSHKLWLPPLVIEAIPRDTQELARFHARALHAILFSFSPLALHHVLQPRPSQPRRRRMIVIVDCAINCSSFVKSGQTTPTVLISPPFCCASLVSRLSSFPTSKVSSTSGNHKAHHPIFSSGSTAALRVYPSPSRE